MARFKITNPIRNKEGIMLADVLVSLGIMLLLTSIALPLYRFYQPNLKLNSAARALVADLRYAQQMTITEQISYNVAFDIPLKSYEIIKTGLATTTIQTIVLPDGIELQSVSGFTADTVAYNAYGAAIESGDIVLKNTNEKTKTISIKPSGYVELVQ